jgi:hypothetical protein
MSTTRTVTVWCDAPDCTEWVYAGNDSRRGASDTDARADAKAKGWSSRREFGGTIDLCPEHTREHA